MNFESRLKYQNIVWIS